MIRQLSFAQFEASLLTKLLMQSKLQLKILVVQKTSTKAQSSDGQRWGLFMTPDQEMQEITNDNKASTNNDQSQLITIWDNPIHLQILTVMNDGHQTQMPLSYNMFPLTLSNVVGFGWF